MNSSTEQRCSDSDDSSDGTSETRCSLDPDRAGGRRRREAPRRDSAAVAVELEEGRGVVVLVQHLRYRRLHEVAHLVADARWVREGRRGAIRGETHPAVAAALELRARVCNRVVDGVVGVSPPATDNKGPALEIGICIDSQDALELGHCARHEIQVRACQIPLEGIVGGARRGEGLVEGGVVLVPGEPVFAEEWLS